MTGTPLEEYQLALDEQAPTTSLTPLRVVAIAALVAFIVGCLPALGTALVVAENLDQRAQQRSHDACEISRDGREAANDRAKQNKINLEADIDFFEFVRDAQPKKVPPGSPITQKTLDQYLAKLDSIIEIKKEKVLPLTAPLSLPDCEARP